MPEEPTADPQAVPPDGTLHPEVERLLCRCIDLTEQRGETAVEELLRDRPEHASEVRGLLDSLRGLDLLDERPFDGGPFGNRVGPYELKGRLGQGGMGVVFLARQPSVDRLVALKVIQPALTAAPGLAERFRREARTLAKLRHPNIVTVFDFGEDRGMLYTAMEFVPGKGLDELLADHRPDLREVISWVRDIARGLQAAHDAGVVHRDVKPSNIRITPDRRAVLLDFGLAKDTGSAGSLTITGAFQGSPRYASPEQVSGSEAVGPATDVYSLGVTLFEACTGQVPFDGATTQQIFQRILEAEPERPRRLAGDLPRDLETIVLAAIERDPERRYHSAAAFADDLQALLELRPIQARPPSRIDQVRRFARRHRALVGGLLAVVLALSAGLIGVYLQYVEAQREAVKAEAVSDFLVDILTLADPAEAMAGKDLTVRAALDQAAAEIGGRFGEQPEVEAEVRFTIGNAYRAIGALDAAEPHVRRALELRVELLGEVHHDVAASINSLALLQDARGEIDEAIALQRRILEVFRRLHGEEHYTVARTLHNLGSALIKREKLAEARAMLERSVALFRKLELPDEQAAIQAAALGQLASLANKEKDRPRAIERYREALAVYRATNHGEHPYAAIDMTNLGVLLVREGDYAAAEPLYLEAAAILERHFAPDNPNCVGIRKNLHRLYVRWDKPDEAAKYAGRK